MCSFEQKIYLGLISGYIYFAESHLCHGEITLLIIIMNVNTKMYAKFETKLGT